MSRMILGLVNLSGWENTDETANARPYAGSMGVSWGIGGI